MTDRLTRTATLVAMGTVLAATVALTAGAAAGDTAIGDAGHFLRLGTRTYLNNPDGEAFSVTVHRFNWVIQGSWNDPMVRIRLTGPAGEVIDDDTYNVGDDGHTLNVPAGTKGVYLLEVNPDKKWQLWWVESTLDQSVAWTGPAEGHAVKDQWFMVNPFVPRRWYFWVPEGTKEFTLLAQNVPGYMSQREDYGFTVYSPRGQRMAVLWGQANPDEPPLRQARILTEPGTTGRFWSIECRMGESHTYSDNNFSLKGVPPYVARSPEEWFNPETGKGAPVTFYDESEFIQSARSERARNTNWQHWSPCPSLGDPDNCQIWGNARFAMWNPEGRELKFRVSTYLTRGREGEEKADIRVVAPGGNVLLSKTDYLEHQHDVKTGYPADVLPGVKGVLTATVENTERFMAFSYPGTPLVLIGADAGDGYKRFQVEVGTTREWYFFVPEGTKEFSVRAAATHDTDVMDLQIAAPDRVVEQIYANSGERTVKVPDGMDGKIWHVRADFGSATRILTGGDRPRYPILYLTLDIKGVPGYIAPTWEQWFNPEDPRPAPQR